MQTSFDFSGKKNYGSEDFIVFDGNREIFHFVVNGIILSNNIFLLSGDRKSGKTHICNIWKDRKNAEFLDSKLILGDHKTLIERLPKAIQAFRCYILEDIEPGNIRDENLLYLLNTISQKGAFLLMTSTSELGDFRFESLDLLSRFKNIMNFRIAYPDEEAKKKLLLKLLSDQQIRIEADVLDFLANHIDRSYRQINEVVEKIAAIIFREKTGKLTKPFLKKHIISED